MNEHEADQRRRLQPWWEGLEEDEQELFLALDEDAPIPERFVSDLLARGISIADVHKYPHGMPTYRQPSTLRHFLDELRDR